jgi:putative copper export protein
MDYSDSSYIYLMVFFAFVWLPLIALLSYYVFRSELSRRTKNALYATIIVCPFVGLIAMLFTKKPVFRVRNSEKHLETA